MKLEELEGEVSEVLSDFGTHKLVTFEQRVVNAHDLSECVDIQVLVLLKAKLEKALLLSE